MKIFISAGDPSGDLHGANLIKEISEKVQNPQVELFGFGGSKMANAGADVFDKIADSSIIGFWEPVKNLARLKRNLNLAEKFFIKDKPEGLIIIDYYGYNIHLAKLAKKHKIPVIYYISPQVWATRGGRVQKIKKFVKKVLVIFPFEKEIYERAGIPVEFVGHPLLDIIPNSLTRLPPISDPKGSATVGGYNPLTIGLMPGSRIQEINKHFTQFYEAFVNIGKVNSDVKAIIPVFSDNIKNYIINHFKLDEKKVEFVMHGDYEKRSKMSLCITSSGTATVENMILGVPMLISYKTSWLTYQIAKRLINVKFIGMPNILAEREICQELIQNEATAEKISAKCLEILKNGKILEKMRYDLAETSQKLGGAGATKRAAEIILEEFSV
ncbi:MAG: lipid-A-disaccharide synthase [Elusimicrobiota bacterium]|nr:lipid-A-disaccharide synthase [Elusimicrobiota bacterium]